ncbi:Protein YeeZ [Neolewinella maritima]|uniref:Protein YeeZ n=1 Tax=Neolewinella maritima TaxID=1383882 RepID=A0ABM9B531_9BACT|nr:NAD-dependent epimerase/dehydratase family protein [Neolewinella maritima]CAH1002496.1 Protein YeeZ [Neolewinella maritima]
MKTPQTIAVIGSGWLGLPLANFLATQGHRVRASYRREATQTALLDQNVTPYLLDLPAQLDSLDAFLQDVTTLVITLPPGGRRLGPAAPATYLAALAPLAPYLSADRHVIFTSSTGVYGSTTTGTVTEASPLVPDSHSSQAVAAAEQWLGMHADRLTVLRLAGLFGPGRDPATFFASGRAVTRADAPVNMVHQADVVRAIGLCLDGRTTGTFNVCAATHPAKRTFYGNLSRRTGRALPIFVAGGASGKTVDSSALRRLGWAPQYDNLLI